MFVQTIDHVINKKIKMVCCIDNVLAIEVHVRVKVPNTVHSKCNISNIDST